MKMSKIFLFIISLTAFLLISCHQSTLQQSQQVASQTSEVIIKDQNYEVYDISKYKIPQYQYFVFDTNNEVLDYNVTRTNPPEFIKLSDNILKVCISGGTGVKECIYYNLSNRDISQWYSNILAENKELIARVSLENDSKIIVQNVFSTLKYYKEFIIEYDLATPEGITASFTDEKVEVTVDNNDQIKVFKFIID